MQIRFREYIAGLRIRTSRAEAHGLGEGLALPLPSPVRARQHDKAALRAREAGRARTPGVGELPAGSPGDEWARAARATPHYGYA